MREQTTSRFLQRKLTSDELLEIGKQISDKVIDIEQIESAKRRITPLREEIADLSNKYKNGCEEVQIECRIDYDVPEPGKKSIVRIDTLEVVEVVDMTAEDLQEDIPFTDAEVVDENRLLDSHKDLTIPEEKKDAA